MAREFRDALQQQNIDVILDESTHLPHDSGAYRRSRQTAERLCRKGRTRSSTSIATEFPTRANTHAASTAKTCRVFGCWSDAAIRTARSTGEFAKQMKAVADKQYPGLVKDILSAKARIIRISRRMRFCLSLAHIPSAKERVLNSADMMAKVVSNTLYGPQTGSASAEKERKEGASDAQKPAAKDDDGVSGGVIFLIVAVVAGVLIFAFAQTGSGKAMGEKLGRNVSEMTGGLFGKSRRTKRITNGFTARHGGFSACRAFFYVNA